MSDICPYRTGMVLGAQYSAGHKNVQKMFGIIAIFTFYITLIYRNQLKKMFVRKILYAILLILFIIKKKNVSYKCSKYGILLVKQAIN
jgi:putative effector of murein hydrolase